MNKTANENLLRIWYTRPASDWQTEALAIGNGYMGGLVFGGIKNDRVHINEKTAWNGGPFKGTDYRYGNTNPTDSEKDQEKIKSDLDRIRKKLDEGNSIPVEVCSNDRIAFFTEKGKTYTLLRK